MFLRLAGQPGWTNGPLTPHPDWYLAALFKQIVTPIALNASWSSGGSYDSSFGLHAFCANSTRFGAGSVAVLYENMGSQTVSLTATAGSSSGVSASAWVLTSQPVAATAGSAPPASLTGDSIYCNSKLLSVDGNGLLPADGVPGAQLPAGKPAQLPPYSFGFIVLPAVGAAACM